MGFPNERDNDEFPVIVAHVDQPHVVQLLVPGEALVGEARAQQHRVHREVMLFVLAHRAPGFAEFRQEALSVGARSLPHRSKLKGFASVPLY